MPRIPSTGKRHLRNRNGPTVTKPGTGGRIGTLAGRRILLVSPLPTLPAVLRGLHDTAIFHTRMRALGETLLARLRPDIVLSPLLCDEHDIIDVARRLDRLGYRGALRALSPPLPHADMVLCEVRQLCGRRDFDIIEVLS
ncbi:hypothetical protein [Paenirhodobacter sp.]|uniref:hypothetical protein n=1 Tax=Paenirhodobacter sp. TaxID=1965326 RepID=UPI003B3C6A85